MRWLRRFMAGLTAPFHRQRDEQELDDEIQAYVEAAAEQRMLAGSGREEAYRLARADVGSAAAVKDYVRDAGWESWFENLGRDLRYAGRMLRRNPGFSAVVILTLALGIGANTALFSLVNAVLLKSLPVKDPDQLVRLLFRANSVRHPWTEYDGNSNGDDLTTTGTSFPSLAFERFTERHDMLTDIFAFAPIYQLNLEVNGAAEIAYGQYASGGYYKGLGVEAWRGRVLSDDDDKPGAAPVAVITWQYWQRRFGGDPRVIGMPITVNNVPFTLVGVTQPSFIGALQLGTAAEVTIPLATAKSLMKAEEARDPADWWLLVMGRVKPGISREQVQASLEATFQQAAVDALQASVASGVNKPQISEGIGSPGPGAMNKPTSIKPADYPHLVVSPGGQGQMEVREEYRRPLMLLMIVVGLVLLIACMNVANLLLARSAARQQEIQMRLALGAKRSRLVRQLLTESVLLSVIAGAVGCLFAFWGKDMLAAWASWFNEGAQISPVVDLRVLGFASALALMTGVLFGLLPALRSSASGTLLKSRTSSDRSRSRMAPTLIAAQVAVSLVLLIAAGVFLKTLGNLNAVDVGFDREGLLLFRVNPQTNGYTPQKVELLYNQMLEELRRIPGVRDAALSRHPLLARSHRANGVYIPGRSNREDWETAEVNVLSPSFFETMKIPIVLGRAFSEHDTSSSQPAAVVNETFARKYFPDSNPIGQTFWMRQGPKLWQVVGVSRDAKYTGVRKNTLPTVYQSYLQEPTAQANFEVRFSGRDSAAVATAVRQAVRKVDASLPIFDVRTQEEQAEASIAQERLFAMLSSSMSFLALLLAAIGLYGTMSYAVVRQTQEIGIRMALGAQYGDVVWMVLRETLMLVLAGVIIGVPLAFSASHAAKALIAPLLFGVKGNDPATMAVAVLVLGGVALLAGLVPAWRAARTDPMIALRAE